MKIHIEEDLEKLELTYILNWLKYFGKLIVYIKIKQLLNLRRINSTPGYTSRKTYVHKSTKNMLKNVWFIHYYSNQLYSLLLKSRNKPNVYQQDHGKQIIDTWVRLTDIVMY